jgi:hypothetical protein
LWGKEHEATAVHMHACEGANRKPQTEKVASVVLTRRSKHLVEREPRELARFGHAAARPEVAASGLPRLPRPGPGTMWSCGVVDEHILLCLPIRTTSAREDEG